jgi:hypothetical protein
VGLDKGRTVDTVDTRINSSLDLLLPGVLGSAGVLTRPAGCSETPRHGRVLGCHQLPATQLHALTAITWGRASRLAVEQPRRHTCPHAPHACSRSSAHGSRTAASRCPAVAAAGAATRVGACYRRRAASAYVACRPSPPSCCLHWELHRCCTRWLHDHHQHTFRGRHALGASERDTLGACQGADVSPGRVGLAALGVCESSTLGACEGTTHPCEQASRCVVWRYTALVARGDSSLHCGGGGGAALTHGGWGRCAGGEGRPELDTANRSRPQLNTPAQQQQPRAAQPRAAPQQRPVRPL